MSFSLADVCRNSTCKFSSLALLAVATVLQVVARSTHCINTLPDRHTVLTTLRKHTLRGSFWVIYPGVLIALNPVPHSADILARGSTTLPLVCCTSTTQVSVCDQQMNVREEEAINSTYHPRISAWRSINLPTIDGSASFAASRLYKTPTVSM